MAATSLKVGNQRLLKLADYLSELPRGAYNQCEVAGRSKCAMAHTWDMPAYKRAEKAADKAGEHFGTAEFYGVDKEWIALFGSEGCQDKNGKVATTGKQAAKAIRRVVKHREAA